MKITTINFKTDLVTKQKAQGVAASIGIPLSNLLNAYVHELASTGSVHFTTVEPITEKMEQQIKIAQKEIDSGELSEPFEDTESLFKHLDSL